MEQEVDHCESEKQREVLEECLGVASQLQVDSRTALREQAALHKKEWRDMRARRNGNTVRDVVAPAAAVLTRKQSLGREREQQQQQKQQQQQNQQHKPEHADVQLRTLSWPTSPCVRDSVRGVATSGAKVSTMDQPQGPEHPCTSTWRFQRALIVVHANPADGNTGMSRPPPGCS